MPPWLKLIHGCNAVDETPPPHSETIIPITTSDDRLISCPSFLIPVQPASAVLGEHPQESPLHLWRPRVWSGGCLTLCHRPDFYGCLYQEWAQTQPGEWKRMDKRREGWENMRWRNEEEKRKMGEKMDRRWEQIWLCEKVMGTLI